MVDAKKPKPKRLAVLVGCNYAGTRYELHGCINDVVAMKEVIVSRRFRFEPGDVTILIDSPSPLHDAGNVLPTGANIKNTLRKMISRAAPGDVLFFHYSGHGTLVPAPAGAGRSKDEAIVPCDFNLITDEDFRQLVSGLPAGASFTMVSDSCHSGGLIDNEKEQIGPTAAADSVGQQLGRRFITYDSILQHLTSLSGIESLHVGDHLTALFGADVSSKFSTSAAVTAAAARRGDDAVLLSGCQTDETSADLPEDDEFAGGRPCGAFSNAIQSLLRAHPGRLSNKELVVGVRKLLREEGLEQHPCLYCADRNVGQPFLWQSDATKEEEDAVVGEDAAI